jgi:hypothetical protein
VSREGYTKRVKPEKERHYIVLEVKDVEIKQKTSLSSSVPMQSLIMSTRECPGLKGPNNIQDQREKFGNGCLTAQSSKGYVLAPKQTAVGTSLWSHVSGSSPIEREEMQSH